VPDQWTPMLVGLVGVCVLLFGFSKTAMPVAAVLAGPLLVATLGVPGATGFAVPLLIFGDLFALGYFRQHADWKALRRMIPGVLLGFALTAALFTMLDARTLGRIIGFLILTSAALEVWRQRVDKGGGSVLPGAQSRIAVVFFGTLAGMTTMAANAGGAAMTLYLVKLRMSMRAFMGTSAWFFFILNSLKVPIVLAVGFVDRETLAADLFFAPMIVAGAFIGIYTFNRMNPKVFIDIALALSAVVACWLIVHG
jgi:uncharacterized membrane protein YfcA